MLNLTEDRYNILSGLYCFTHTHTHTLTYTHVLTHTHSHTYIHPHITHTHVRTHLPRRVLSWPMSPCNPCCDFWRTLVPFCCQLLFLADQSCYQPLQVISRNGYHHHTAVISTVLTNHWYVISIFYPSNLRGRERERGEMSVSACVYVYVSV